LAFKVASIDGESAWDSGHLRSMARRGDSGINSCFVLLRERGLVILRVEEIPLSVVRALLLLSSYLVDLAIIAVFCCFFYLDLETIFLIWDPEWCLGDL
jgi:hypothetical protein